MKYLIILLLLAGCGNGCNGEYCTPEQQGEMIKRCDANGMTWAIGDWGRVYCAKK